MKENSATVEPEGTEPKDSSRPEQADQFGTGEWILIALVCICIALTFPLSVWLCIMIVNEYEEAVVFRLGHLQKEPKGPGTHFILPCTDKVISVDMRTKSVNVLLQEVLTKDPLQIQVDTVVYFRVQNAILSVMSVADADKATLLLMESTLKKILETKYLFQIVTDREKIAETAQSTVNDTAGNWGIKVEDVEIKDVITKVKVASGGGGKTPPSVVKEASIVITESPMSLQFHCKQRETYVPPVSVQTEREIAQQSSTIVFRYP